MLLRASHARRVDHMQRKTDWRPPVLPCAPSPLQLTKLATFSDDPNPAVTRVLFTPTDMAARA